MSDSLENQLQKWILFFFNSIKSKQLKILHFISLSVLCIQLSVIQMYDKCKVVDNLCCSRHIKLVFGGTYFFTFQHTLWHYYKSGYGWNVVTWLQTVAMGNWNYDLGKPFQLDFHFGGTGVNV